MADFYFDIAFPQRRIMSTKNMDTYYKLVNLYNGKRPIYRSLYHFQKAEDNRVIANSAIIDKIYFDFDGEDAYDQMQRLHNWLNENNYMHQVMFSGSKGYNVYVFLKPKLATEVNLVAIHRYIENKADVRSDQQTVGDINRVSRVPNTLHIKSKLYCVPLDSSIINEGDSSIREYAKETRGVSHVFGDKRIPTLNTQKQGEQFMALERFEPQVMKSDSKRLQKLIDDETIYPCIKAMLCNENLEWRGRFFLILYFKERGYTKQEINEILEQSLTPDKYHHAVYLERQLSYLFSKDFLFPNCNKLVQEGFCVEPNCEKEDSIYR